MQIGIIGGTGPAGRGLGARLAVVGHEVVIGGRDRERSRQVVGDLIGRWPDRRLAMTGDDNATAADAEVVVVATPWDGAASTVGALADRLSGKVVISMANALAKQGRELLALVPPRGSVAASVQAALPGALVSAAFHHLPASRMEALDGPVDSDVLVCSDHPEATRTTLEVVDGIAGLRGVDAGSLAQAAPIEAFTAVLITINIRHKAHAAIRLTGVGRG